MEVVVFITTLVLLVWFFGCVVTYRIGKYLLVEGTGLKGVEFRFLVVYALSILTYLLYRPVGQWVLLGVLIFWIVIQFFCHWYYTIFGVTEKKLTGYNQCFRGTVKLFPESSTRLIPDLYHTVLHFLILLDILFLAANISRNFA